jgi:hypothetical protein
MVSLRALSLFALGNLLSVGITSAAPLHLASSQIDAKIAGSISGQAGPSYSASSYSSGSWNCRLADAVGTPSNATGTVGSSAGVRIEQLAPNEFVFTLSGASKGGYQPGSTDPAIQYSSYSANSHVGLNAAITIDSYPGHEVGAPATINISVQHIGDMSSTNNAYASNYATVSMYTAGGSFGYTKSPYLPSGNYPDFTDVTVTGHRDATASGSYSGLVGQTLVLSALFDTSVSSRQSSQNHLGSSSGFEDGLRIHLTVMPEPTAAILGLLGAAFIGFRRRK